MLQRIAYYRRLFVLAGERHECKLACIGLHAVDRHTNRETVTM
ncbi:MAG: hypothetical protein K0R08_217 [Solimicrobium sp.]|jgi:hypothetical protein|nr:hypothetical protein [Solimicrobium sp.]